MRAHRHICFSFGQRVWSGCSGGGPCRWIGPWNSPNRRRAGIGAELRCFSLRGGLRGAQETKQTLSAGVCFSRSTSKNFSVWCTIWLWGGVLRGASRFSMNEVMHFLRSPRSCWSGSPFAQRSLALVTCFMGKKDHFPLKNSSVRKSLSKLTP